MTIKTEKHKKSKIYVVQMKHAKDKHQQSRKLLILIIAISTDDW